MHTLLLALLLVPGDGDAVDRAVARAVERTQAKLETQLALFDDHSSWENAWEIETPSYRVTTSLNWYIGRRLGTDLETMLGYFRELTGTEWRPPTPMPFHLYPTLGEYNQFGNNFGEHHSSVLGSFYATQHPDRPVAMYFHASKKQLAIWATHSAFHQFVDRAFANAPPIWVAEGLASYFAIFYWDQSYGMAEFERIARSDAWIPLAQIQREGLDIYPADPHTRFIELGMVFNYLLHYRPDTRTQKNEDGVVLLSPAADYCADLLRGRDVSRHPVHDLLNSGLAEFEAELRAYTFTSR